MFKVRLADLVIEIDNHYKYIEDFCAGYTVADDMAADFSVGISDDTELEREKESGMFDKGYLKEGDWALNVKSVIVFGRIRIVEDFDEAIELCRKLSCKFTDDESYINEEIEKCAKATLVMELDIEHMTGKLVNEK